MSSGKQHDRHCYICTPIVAGAIALLSPALVLPLLAIPIGAIAFLFGGLYLSPDLDILSRPYRRLGLLRWYWWPYQKAMAHRGVSHMPILGTASRLAYLLLPTAIALQLPLWNAMTHPLGLVAIACIELSVWVHLLGDSIPLR